MSRLLDTAKLLNYHVTMVMLATLVSTLILIGLYTAVDIYFTKQTFWLKNICFGVFYFFGMFLIVSAALFAIDKYSLWLTYGICFAIGAVAFVIAILYATKTDPDKTDAAAFSPTALKCLIALLAVGIAVSWGKFEVFGMGQDQGVYQAAAIYRTAGHNGREIDLPGYHTLTNESDRALFRNAVYAARSNAGTHGNLLGYYYSTSGYRLYYEPLSEVSGPIHGIPNYAALLSITGIIFGLSGMLHIQTLFFLASIGLLFIILNCNLKLKPIMSTIMTSLFILSPIVIWTTKTSLTECVLTLIIMAFLYLITSPERYANKLLWFPVTVFAFFHVSIYTMMPMFILLFIFMYMQKRDNNIIISAVISLAAYIAGFFMMIHASNGYTLENYKWLRELLSIQHFGYDEFIMFLSLSTLAAAAIVLALRFVIKRFSIGLNPKVFLNICKYSTLACLLYMAVWWTLYYLNGAVPDSWIYLRGLISSLPEVTFVGYALLSGFIVFPLVIYAFFAKNSAKNSTKNSAQMHIYTSENVIPVVAVFIYCVVIYSTVMRIEIPYYYYYARYLAPFVPIILILGGVYLDTIKPKARVVTACVSLLLTAPFALFMVFNKDLTRVDWDTFEEIVSAVEEMDENDILLVSAESTRYFFLPLNALTDVTVLPAEGYSFLSADADAENAGNAESGRVFLLSRSKEYNTENSIEFDAKSSEYPILPGIIPPLPFQVDRGNPTFCLTEIG